MNIEEELKKLPENYMLCSLKNAKAEADFKNLNEQSKNLLATLKSKHQANSETERERLALSSDKWMIHINGLNEAREEHLRLRSHLKALEVKLSCLQSLNSRYVSEMKLT